MNNKKNMHLYIQTFSHLVHKLAELLLSDGALVAALVSQLDHVGNHLLP